jgi:formylglycine-generating enzyme required for sulfatase activity
MIFLTSCGQHKQDKVVSKMTSKIDGFEMINVKGGTFTMGGTDNSHSGKGQDECPHSVTIKDFSIGKYEVTQAEWKDVMGNNPSYYKDDKNPVEQVSWEDVQVFIGRLNIKHSEHFRLPTEEEWEFAARGGLQSKNYRYSGSDNVNDVAWWENNSGGRPHSVGNLKPNELGIYDMSGNIWEWCSDFKEPYPCDLEGKSFKNISKVLRGGTYEIDSSSVRVRDRNGRGVDLRLPELGFRLAK